jgi:hypothetical protein
LKAWKDRERKGKKGGGESSTLRERKNTLQKQADNIIDAIAATKGSALLHERLTSIERQIRTIDDLLSSHKQRGIAAPSPSEMQDFVDRKLAIPRSLFGRNRELTKQLVLKHVGKLVMKPKYEKGVPAYEVSGDVHLFVSQDRSGHRSRCSTVADSISVPDYDRAAVA